MNTISNKKEADLRVLDLFCGCGGLSVGAAMAGSKIVAGVDIEEKYIASFKHNFPESKAFTLDIATTKPEDLASLINHFEQPIEIIVGGPPCQGFSKNVPLKNRDIDSENNKLINSFLLYCEYFSPKIILMENVAEIKNGYDGKYAEKIKIKLKSLGYGIEEYIINSADYGIPQRRRRAFFIASKSHQKLNIPEKTHSKENHISVWDAISDLPTLELGESKIEYRTPPSNSYQESVRDKNISHVTNHFAKKLSKIQESRIRALKPGQGLKDLPEELQVKGGYSGAYGRLTKTMIAPTITRWVFHPGSGRWGHPVDFRLISIREAARLQGFPDWYEFIGTYTDQAGQLGNAVPPLLVKKILEGIIS